MNVFIVQTHPAPRSTNDALTACALQTLSERGHAVQVSGLDIGETLIKPGDILGQRGTNHAWANRSDRPVPRLLRRHQRRAAARVAMSTSRELAPPRCITSNPNPNSCDPCICVGREKEQP